jgi:hypothetical protein
VTARSPAELAAMMRDWANAVERYTVLVRPGTGRLHDMAGELRQAAAEVEQLAPAGRADTPPAPPASTAPAVPPARTGRCGMGMDRPPPPGPGR